MSTDVAVTFLVAGINRHHFASPQLSSVYQIFPIYRWRSACPCTNIRCQAVRPTVHQFGHRRLRACALMRVKRHAAIATRCSQHRVVEECRDGSFLNIRRFPRVNDGPHRRQFEEQCGRCRRGARCRNMCTALVKHRSPFCDVLPTGQRSFV